MKVLLIVGEGDITVRLLAGKPLVAQLFSGNFYK